MLGKIKHLYQTSNFHPLSPKSMLKLKESPPFESFGPGSIAKITLTWGGGGGGGMGRDRFTFPEKSRFSKQNSQDILSGVVRTIKLNQS